MGKRIGLVGYNANTGLGELNRQVATYLDISHWLIISHRQHPINKVPEGVEHTVHNVRSNTGNVVDSFLKKVDVVLFFETEYQPGLAKRAKDLGKEVVCVPMLEWMPEIPSGWTRYVDRFLCVTDMCYSQLAKESPRCIRVNWPVDTLRFKGRVRTTCNQFLFCEAKGGWKGRKGADFVKKCLDLWPDMPLIVRSQANIDGWKLLGCETTYGKPGDSNSEVYNQGDVLIAPHHLDGYGLGPVEAMASGMPVITPDANPWAEIPALYRIPIERIETIRVRRPMPWVYVSPSYFVDYAQQLVGEDITDYSEEALEWASENSWITSSDYIEDMITQ